MKPFVVCVLLLLMVFVVLRGFLPGLFGKRGSGRGDPRAANYSDAYDVITDASHHGHDASGGGGADGAH